MGGELVTGSLSLEGDGSNMAPAPLLSYTEQFYQQLPFYLSIGMTPEQYWDEDCTLVVAYRQAYELKRKERNNDLWLQGLYIYHALCNVAPLFRFSTKPQKAGQYLSEPFPISEKDRQEKEQREERDRFLRIRAKMEAQVSKTAHQEVNKDGIG